MRILLDDDGFRGARLGSLRELIHWAEPVAAVGVDIPIGHVSDGFRRADVEARHFVGTRSSSVFPAPPADVHRATSYEQTNEILVALGRPKLSQQAWALVPKIVEAAEVAEADRRVLGVHREVSFPEMAGRPLRWSKKSWNGVMLRRRLVADAGVVLPDEIPDIESAVSDDVVDAAVAAWSARRCATGTARSLPHPPESNAGRQVAIWC